MERIIIDGYENDIPLLYHYMDVSTTSVALYVNCGSSCENTKNNGISHFIEHMVFKGTEKRSGLKINEMFDVYACRYNAYTTRNYTCYYAQAIPKYLDKVADLISDIVFKSKLSQKDLDMERGVIIAEYLRDLDDDFGSCHDELLKLQFSDSSIGQAIIGTLDNIEKFTAEDLIEYKNKNYVKENIALVLVGNVSKDEAIKIYKKYFAGLAASGVKNSTKGYPLQLDIKDNVCNIDVDTKQSNISIGISGEPYANDKEKIMAKLICDALVTSTSSRLWKILREKYGLVYQIHMYTLEDFNSLASVISFIANEYDVMKIVKIITSEIIKMKNSGLSANELKRIKIAQENALSLGADMPNEIGMHMYNSYINTGKMLSLDELKEILNNITLDEINKYLLKFLKNDKITLAHVGKKIKLDLDKAYNKLMEI